MKKRSSHLEAVVESSQHENHRQWSYRPTADQQYRSESERLIAAILKSDSIRFTYEDALPVNVHSRYGKRNAIWHPDFHLHESDILIEYVGLPDDEQYMEGIAKKKSVYEAMGKTVVWLFPEDVWEELNGSYQKRIDVTEHVLRKVYAGMREQRAQHYSKRESGYRRVRQSRLTNV